MPRKVFISYDHSEDRYYKDLLRAWDANSSFEFRFDLRSPNVPINSDRAAVIKQSLTRMLRSSSYFLVLVGKYSHKSKWMAWEIARAKAEDVNLRIGVVKIDNSFITPAGLLGIGVPIARSFTRENVLDVLRNAQTSAV